METKTPQPILEVKNLSIGIHRPVKGKKMRGGSDSILLSSVEDISFDIYPGEILGIVGESGSGKSLTALSITGLLGDNKEITGGSILLQSNESGHTCRDLTTLGEDEFRFIRGKDISMIFQEPFSSLNPLMKIGAQIEETLELHREKDRAGNKKRVIELMEKLKLPEPEKLINTYPHRLSGGMCQRVMIALALICRPRLLIADEPTTALDNSTQDQIISLLNEINRDFGTSILFISHDLSLVKKLCRRVIVMYSGRFLEIGDTEEIFNNPAHEYTRCLIDSIPKRTNRGKPLKVITGRIPSLEEGRPPGCPFHPRCAKAGPECKTDFPPAKVVKATGNSSAVTHLTHCVLGAP